MASVRRSLTALFAAGAVAAAAPELEVLARVRSGLLTAADSAEGSDVAIPSGDALDTAIKALAKAEKSFGVDAAGQAAKQVVTEARDGYERLKNLSSTVHTADDLQRLQKAVDKALRKQKKANNFDKDDTFLESKAEKKEREAAIERATEAVEKAKGALADARASARAREPRPLLMPRLSSVAAAQLSAKKKGVQVLSEAPLVIVIDDWLGKVGKAALERFPSAFANLTAAGATKLATNASDLPPRAGPGDGGEGGAPPPQLCLPLDKETRAPSAAYLALVEGAMAASRTLRDAGKEHCAATAALTDEAPDGWDAEEDGDFVGSFSAVADRFDASGCGPLTAAMDDALTTSDATYLTSSTLAEADILDLAISDAVGFGGADVEGLASEILEGLESRVDTAAVPPDDWDAEEDGEWEPPMLAASDATTLLAAVVKRGGDAAAALADAYAYSSSVEVVTHLAKQVGGGKKAAAAGVHAGGEAPHFLCDDFSREQEPGEPYPAFGAVLFAGAAAAAAGTSGKGTVKGGDVRFPALGVSVAPKAGRLLLFETTLPGGSCDPASAIATSPLGAGSADLLLLRKLYYSDPSFSREKFNSEGPSRMPPKVDCRAAHGAGTSKFGCRRRGHVGAPSGDAVLPLRERRDARKCMPPGAAGPCDKPPGYEPPPPPPKKAKKAKAAPTATTPPSTPPAEQAPSAPPPVGGAPPPIQR